MQKASKDGTGNLRTESWESKEKRREKYLNPAGRTDKIKEYNPVKIMRGQNRVNSR